MTWRIFWFLVKLGIVGALAVYFATKPGRVSIDWLGYAVDMPVGIAALIVLILVLMLVYGERIRHAVFGFPSRWRAQRKAIREMKGYRALTLGMVAVAAGDVYESRRQSRRARDLLTEAPLTKLLQAQTARLSGDDQAATQYFQDMRGDPEVAFLGIRGLMTQALRDGDKAQALELAEEARKLRPAAKWVLLELLDLQVELGKWNRALATLEEAERTGALSSEEAAPIRARLSVSQAERLLEIGNDSDALKLAQKAVKADASNQDSVVLAADLLNRFRKNNKAEKLIEDAWKKEPTPNLAAAYHALGPRDATPLTQVKRFERLLSLAPDAPEGHIALAEASLDAQLWGEARRHLTAATNALEEPAPGRLCRLWAQLEESEHGDLAKAHDWLMRAADAAPADPPTPEPPLSARRDETLPV